MELNYVDGASMKHCMNIRNASGKLLAGLCGIIAMLPAMAAGDRTCTRVIVTGDPDYPPFSSYENKVFLGSAIEIAVLALDRIHMPYEVRYIGAFPHVLEEARAGTIDLIAELKNTPDRRAYLTYSRVPIFTNPMAVFIRAGQKFPYESWNDLIGKRGVITASNKFGGGFDEFLAARLTIDPADTIALSFSRLGRGKSDYFVNSYYPAITYLLRMKQEADFKVLQPFVTATENFAAWATASPCADKREEFDAALSAMVKSGEVRRILDGGLEKLHHGSSPK